MFRSLTLLCTAAALAWASAPAVAQSPRFLKQTAEEWTVQLKGAKAADRRNAAFALGKLGTGLADLKQAYPKEPERWQAWATELDGALANIKQLYANEQDARTREAMVLAMGEIAAGTGAADPQLRSLLIDALQRDQDQDKYVRRSAALALGMLASKDGKVRTALSQALSDPEQVVRQNAGWVLGQFGPKVAPDLVRALNDGSCDSLVKRDVANALLKVAHDDPRLMRDAMNALLGMCKDKDSEVRKAGLAPLIEIVSAKDTEAIPVLKAALHDPDAEVARFAALALSNVGGAAAAEAMPILRDALQHGELYLKRAAAFAMHNIGATAAPAVDDLVQALRSPDEKLRKYAAMALGKIGMAAGPAVAPLAQIVTDAKLPNKLRVPAAEALSEMGDEAHRAGKEIAELRQQLPELLHVLGNANEDGELCARLSWVLNAFFDNPAVMESCKATMESVCAESATKDSGMARYQCAYLLGLRFQQKANDAVLNVLKEWLYDDTGKIYEGQDTKVGGASSERQGANQSQLKVVGDSRSMAVQALGKVGRDRVVARKEIIEQVRRLANDAATFPTLKTDGATC